MCTKCKDSKVLMSLNPNGLSIRPCTCSDLSQIGAIATVLARIEKNRQTAKVFIQAAKSRRAVHYMGYKIKVTRQR